MERQVLQTMQASPALCKQLMGSFPVNFFLPYSLSQHTVYMWQVGQRRLVLLYLYMAVTAGGLVSGKLIMQSARRVRVTCVTAALPLCSFLCVLCVMPGHV